MASWHASSALYGLVTGLMLRTAVPELVCACGTVRHALPGANSELSCQDLREQGIIKGEEWVLALRQKCEVGPFLRSDMPWTALR